MRKKQQDAKLIEALADYRSTKEAAAILGMYEQSVRKAIEQKRLRAIKIGRDFFIHINDLAEYQQNGAKKQRKN